MFSIAIVIVIQPNTLSKDRKRVKQRNHKTQQWSLKSVRRVFKYIHAMVLQHSIS